MSEDYELSHRNSSKLSMSFASKMRRHPHCGTWNLELQYDMHYTLLYELQYKRACRPEISHVIAICSSQVLHGHAVPWNGSCRDCLRNLDSICNVIDQKSLAGTLRVDGVMQGRCRMFDTPGVPHDHQISSLLTPDEVHKIVMAFVIKLMN